uniref:PDZ domain-containing protein n=4 Tax=Clastoptera arizonana TaxID=38151 RepID=A0A1B6D9V6_9HEMI
MNFKLVIFFSVIIISGISHISENIKSCRKLTYLNLSMNPLGQFPDGVTQLISLENLYMSSTMIDFIPANIGRLSRLEIFELRDNMLSALPKAFARLNNLTCLDIGHNDFTELPEAVGELHALQHLWMEGNDIEELPMFVNGLWNLVHLDCTSTDVRIVSKNIGALTNLVYLTLSNAKLKILPVSIGRLKNLVTLRLDGNELQILPKSIGYLENLEQLYLSLNKLEIIPASIGLLRKLIYLDLSFNYLDLLPPEIGSCCNLRILNVPNNYLRRIPAEIGNLVNLKVCNLMNNRLDYLPISVLKLRNLKALWLSYNQTKPLITLVKEFHYKSHCSVLTCYLLPQRDEEFDETSNSNSQTEKKESVSNSEDHRHSRPRIRFSIDPLLDRQSHLSRTPTPYPRRLKNMAKNINNAVLQSRPEESAYNLDGHLYANTPNQPPPYHIAAMKSKQVSFLKNMSLEMSDDNDISYSMVASGSYSLASQFSRSGSSDELFSSHVNQDLFVNKELLKKKRKTKRRSKERESVKSNNKEKELLYNENVTSNEIQEKFIRDEIGCENKLEQRQEGDPIQIDQDSVATVSPDIQESVDISQHQDDLKIEESYSMNNCINTNTNSTVEKKIDSADDFKVIDSKEPSLSKEICQTPNDDTVENETESNAHTKENSGYMQDVASYSKTNQLPSGKPKSSWVFGAHKNRTVVEVTIVKHDFDLGFQLDFQPEGVFVKDVTLESPASEVVKEGDKILQINGVTLLDDLDAEELISTLEGFSRPFNMLISRI